MTAVPIKHTAYLSAQLELLAPYIDRAGVTDVYVNRPGELWVETTSGATERHDLPALSDALLHQFARQVAAASHQGINREHPLLSAILPNGARVQFVAPPATRGSMAMAIRRQDARDLSLEDYEAAGAFVLQDTDVSAQGFEQLRHWRDQGQYAALFSAAVAGRKNILVSGGTATGKTTFANALIKEIPHGERLLYIEDTPELNLIHPNAVGLVSARGALGESRTSMEDLLTAALRMRPDRIILGEVRGPEAFTFLRAINTGHPGSLTTVHADSPERAIEQLVLLVLQTGTRLDRGAVAHYVRQSIDVYVQLARQGGKRIVSHVTLRDELNQAEEV